MTKNALPIDLTWMTRDRLSRAEIFKLMGKAKTEVKRLFNINTTFYNYIKDLKGGYPVCILCKTC